MIMIIARSVLKHVVNVPMHAGISQGLKDNQSVRNTPKTPGTNLNNLYRLPGDLIICPDKKFNEGTNILA